MNYGATLEIFVFKSLGVTDPPLLFLAFFKREQYDSDIYYDLNGL
jgi:hypothetical protein